MTKICSRCGKDKAFADFHKNSWSKDGLFARCVACRNLEQKKYYQKTKDSKHQYYLTHKQEIANRKKSYHKTHTDELKLKNRRYYQLNQEKLKAKARLYYHNNYQEIKAKKAAYIKHRLKTDINFKLLATLRNRIRMAISKNYKKTSTKELLGCTIEEVRAHLEKQFKPGMSWSNYGNTGWHVDHILPCASFDLTDLASQKACFCYTNLQPLWARENLKKSANCVII